MSSGSGLVRIGLLGSGRRAAVWLGMVAMLGVGLVTSLGQAPAPAAKPDAAAQRKEQLALDSAQLLKLATELKAAVDKSNKDELSIPVVKEAGEVEKLARKVREEMKSAGQAK